MLSTLSTEPNSVQHWTEVIAQLTTKQQQANQHIERLRAEKRSLALEAALGSEPAKKKLDKINAELTKLAFDADDFVVAIAAATAEKQRAEQAVKDAEERQWHSELCKIAGTAIAAAAKYTEAVRSAVTAGRAAREALRAMTMLTKSDSNLQRLLDSSPFMRTAEFEGLREFLEFAPYRGPKEHLGPLESEFESLLGRWRKE
jgi:hypothetical protein